MKTFLNFVTMFLAVMAHEKIPDVIIGDPNDSTNDILGAPISEEEFEESLNLNLSQALTSKNDPISSSGFFQGDIMVDSEDQLLQILLGDTEGQYSAITNPKKSWPNGVIPYVISASYSSSERGVIARAMAEYHQKTCIRFVPRSTHADYIHILKGQGCSSTVGRAGGSQVVSLGYNCVHFGVVLHELMHAAGFWHEQSRSDRDTYVAINWANIYPHLQYNFEKKSNAVTQNLGLGYDYASIMHYGPYAFSLNGRPTISPRRSGVTIGQRNGFSSLDIQGLNLLYKCSGTIPKPSGCVDNEVNCGYWAAVGYCTANAAYMTVNCKKSCKFCSDSCADQGAFCTSWASQGECERNPGYMKLMCKKACKLCESTTESTSCSDQNQYCKDWASKGECQRNPAYMTDACAKSCNLC